MLELKNLHFTVSDENGEKHILKAKGFFARAICHEVDHLDGVLYIDKATHIEKA